MSLDKTGWDIFIVGGSSIVIPWVLGIPTKDLIYFVPPLMVVVFIMTNYLLLKEQGIVDKLNDGLKNAMQKPVTWLITWFSLTAVVGWVFEELLDFIEPLLDVFEIFLPAGFDIAWILSPYSPRFLALSALANMFLSLFLLDSLQYTIQSCAYFLYKITGSLSALDFLKQYCYNGEPPNKHMYYHSEGGGRGTNNYGWRHIPRDFVQMLFAQPISIIGAFYEVCKDPTSMAKWTDFFVSPICGPMFLWHRFGDLLTDFILFKSDTSVKKGKVMICLDYFFYRPSPTGKGNALLIPNLLTATNEELKGIWTQPC